jgi:hypothetical protein
MRIEIIRGSDWQALYVDGELRAEGHVLTPEMVALVLGATVVHPNISQEKIERDLDHYARCPGTLGALARGEWDDHKHTIIQP